MVSSGPSVDPWVSFLHFNQLVMNEILIHPAQNQNLKELVSDKYYPINNFCILNSSENVLPFGLDQNRPDLVILENSDRLQENSVIHLVSYFE